MTNDEGIQGRGQAPPLLDRVDVARGSSFVPVAARIIGDSLVGFWVDETAQKETQGESSFGFE